jgi:D-alanine-D-alanine ligase
MNIAVLMGGISPERNVSLNGGLSVAKALREKGHNIVAVDPTFGKNGIIKEFELINMSVFPDIEELMKFDTKNYIECINSEIFDNIDLAFIVLHGINGEDGKIQALLELRGIPYTGSGIKASSVAIDKLSSKLLFLAAGISTPPWSVIRKKDYDNYDFFKEIRSELGNKLVIKPNNQGSTVGITIVKDGNLDDIHHGIINASKYSDIVLIEQFIEGREITVGVLNGEALPVIEIITSEGFYDYNHKYTKGNTQYICPAEISEDIEEFTQSLAVSAYNVIDCKGVARADFRLSDEGQPFLLEINTIPGFTETSLVPMAAKEVELDFADLCEELVNLALNNNSIKEQDNE